MSARFRSQVAVFCIASVLVLAWVASVSAQVQRGAAPRNPPVDASGTIDAMAPGLLRIKSVAGQAWMLQLTRETTVHVMGTAKPDVLRPGGFISFVAKVEKRQSRIEEKVGKLTLFTLSEERPLGAFPSQTGFGDAGSEPATAEQPDAEPDARKKPNRRKDEGPAVQEFEIVGRITGIDKTGKIKVFAPNTYFRTPVQIELTEEPEIELDLTGPTMLRLAKIGDKVLGRGTLVAESVVRLRELTIELAEPFTTVHPKEEKKRSTRRTSRSSRRKQVEPEEPEEGAEPKKDQDEPPT